MTKASGDASLQLDHGVIGMPVMVIYESKKSIPEHLHHPRQSATKLQAINSVSLYLRGFFRS